MVLNKVYKRDLEGRLKKKKSINRISKVCLERIQRRKVFCTEAVINKIKHILDFSVRKKTSNGMTNHEINNYFIVEILCER